MANSDAVSSAAPIATGLGVAPERVAAREFFPDDGRGEQGGGARAQERDQPPGHEPRHASHGHPMDDEMVERRIVKHQERVLLHVPVHPRPRDQRGLLPDDALAVVELCGERQGKHPVMDEAPARSQEQESQ